jgi:UDP-N-acetyl-D-glucosamine dehydrogenase
MGLKERLADGSAVFGVLGLGYVGLPLAVEMAAAGHRVVGFDVFDDKVARVNAADSYNADIASETLAPLVTAGLLCATTDFARVCECDAVVICVPTPLNEMKEPDVSFVVEAAESVTPFLKHGVLVALESTTYPGTTEEILQPILERSGLRVGDGFFLAFSPERVDPGNEMYSTKNTTKIVGGVTSECTEVAVAFYSAFLDDVVAVSSTRVAEMTKLLENIFRCVNIALVNELLMLCGRMGIDIWEVVDAAKTKPFGFMPFYPGPGLGGHCIPIDPFYLSWKAREYDFHTAFIELAGKVNEDMPYYVVSRAMDSLNDVGKALSKCRVLIVGVAYKADIEDMRESPAIRISELLLEKGANVAYHDPHVAEFSVSGTELERCDLTTETVAGADLVLIVTAHTGVDYALIGAESRLVLDTRNALKGLASPSVVRL